MIYKIDNFNNNIIQYIRLFHTLNEIGILIWLDSYDVFKPLNKFGIVYPENDDVDMKDISDNILVIHDKPLTRVCDVTKPIMFPKIIVKYCLFNWSDNRNDELFFIGKYTNKRSNAISNSSLHIKPLYTNNGRDLSIKAWDEEYYNLLLTSKFTIVLDGDFVWTYRFWEACLCGSIPIIDNYCEHYNGYIYYTLNDDIKNIIYSEDIAIHNYNLAVSQLTLNDYDIEQIRIGI